MADFVAILTNAGAAALAARTTSSPVLLATMVLGDANGASYDPNPVQTALIHQLAVVPIDTVQTDATNANWVNIAAVVPIEVGGFTIREVGLKLADGTLFAVIKYPPTFKPAAGDGQELEMLITVTLVVSSTADIEVVASGTVYASQNYVQASRDFYAVLSATTAAPPVTPSTSDTYLIPADATGAWAGLEDRIAIWFGDDWFYILPKVGCHVDTGGALLRYTVTGWLPLTASSTKVGLVELATGAETIAGTDAERAVTPAALAGLTASDARRGLVELATGAETIAGTDAERAVTPAALAGLTASDARRGLVELATPGEVLAGERTDLAVTPFGVSIAVGLIDSDSYFLGMF